MAQDAPAEERSAARGRALGRATRGLAKGSVAKGSRARHEARPSRRPGVARDGQHLDLATDRGFTAIRRCASGFRTALTPSGRQMSLARELQHQDFQRAVDRPLSRISQQRSRDANHFFSGCCAFTVFLPTISGPLPNTVRAAATRLMRTYRSKCGRRSALCVSATTVRSRAGFP
jgi:hypothetical protein